MFVNSRPPSEINFVCLKNADILILDFKFECLTTIRSIPIPTQVKFIDQTVAERLQRKGISLQLSIETIKTNRINEINTIKQTPQDKNSSLTMETFPYFGH